MTDNRIIIELNEAILKAAISESTRRIAHTKLTGAMDHTSKGSLTASNMGVIGETAMSILTGFTLDGFNYSGQTKKTDVGPIQVRTTQRDVLYFKDFENPWHPYVAIRVSPFTSYPVLASIEGWRFGFECIKPEWQKFPKNVRNMRPGQKCWWEAPHETLYGLKSLYYWCQSIGSEWPRGWSDSEGQTCTTQPEDALLLERNPHA